ncbi:hypothetical protein RUM43_005866 [Polyplax serrata]|uniref:Uncharacterized protein n=1 Tax=Polyplax serrata TaxID=468196 RepID=A0AAN8NWT8_POLSC
MEIHGVSVHGGRCSQFPRRTNTCGDFLNECLTVDMPHTCHLYSSIKPREPDGGREYPSTVKGDRGIRPIGHTDLVGAHVLRTSVWFTCVEP